MTHVRPLIARLIRCTPLHTVGTCEPRNLITSSEVEYAAGMSTTLEIPFSRLLQHSGETVARLEESHNRRVRLVRRDGEDLILESAKRAEAEAEIILVTARILTALVDLDAPVLLKAFPVAFPWVRFLPAEDAHAFVEEFTATVRACADLGSVAALSPVIEAWRATAEIHADPELHASLTAPLDGSDYGPARKTATSERQTR
jgi:hypothetical protein